MNNDFTPVEKAFAVAILSLTAYTIAKGTAKTYQSLKLLRRLNRTAKKWEHVADYYGQLVEQGQIDQEFINIINNNQL